jgi:hypothetical protein
MKSNRWRKGKDPKTKKVSTGPFSRDIILLSGPDDKDIPHQGSKVFLQENGHIISAFQFHKEWSDIDVERVHTSPSLTKKSIHIKVK